MSSKVNRRHFLKYAGAGLVAGAAAVGGYYFYQSSTPGPSGWTYVALGDSWTGQPCGTSYVAYYAGHIESDLGVKVRALNEGKKMFSSSELLSALRGESEHGIMRNEVSDAKVVTFLIGGNTAAGIVLNAGVTDVPKALAPWRAIYDAVIDEIVSLRSPSDTIIRAIDYPNAWVSQFTKQGILDAQIRANGAAFCEQIVEAASEHNIPVARASLEWNGPNLDEDPAAKGYTCGDVSDPTFFGVHPNEAGSRAIAEALRKTGYKPLGP